MDLRPGTAPRYDPAMADSGVRLSDLLVALSLATDLGFGQPSEHMLRSARIGMRLGERLGLDADGAGHALRRQHPDLRRLPDLRERGGPALRRRHRLPRRRVEVDLAGFPAMVFMLRRAGSGTSAFNRARQAAALMATGGRQVVAADGEPLLGRRRAGRPARAGRRRAGRHRAGLRPVGRSGLPRRPVRHRAVPGGADLARGRGLRGVPADGRRPRRRSTSSAPAAAPTSTPRSRRWWRPIPSRCSTDLDRDTVDEVLAAEPLERPPLTDDELDEALGAIGDFCDLRCPFFAGHARATAELVRGAAELMQMPADEARLAYRAALVHDVGRFGVSGIGLGQAGTADGQRAGTRAPARLLRRADLQPARAAAAHRPAGGHPPRADGRLRLPPRRRRRDALVPGPGARGRRRVQRHAGTASVPGRTERVRGSPRAEGGGGRRSPRSGRGRRGAGRRRAPR